MTCEKAVGRKRTILMNFKGGPSRNQHVPTLSIWNNALILKNYLQFFLPFFRQLILPLPHYADDVSCRADPLAQTHIMQVYDYVVWETPDPKSQTLCGCHKCKRPRSPQVQQLGHDVAGGRDQVFLPWRT